MLKQHVIRFIITVFQIPNIQSQAVRVKKSKLGLYKILLFIIPLLFGCTGEYCCYPEEIESIERGCGGFNYTVNWPDGEKEAEEQCEEELEGEVFMSPGEGKTIVVQGCRCEKAD